MAGTKKPGRNPGGRHERNRGRRAWPPPVDVAAAVHAGRAGAGAGRPLDGAAGRAGAGGGVPATGADAASPEERAVRTAADAPTSRPSSIRRSRCSSALALRW
ncbi:hypothetical protein G6F23_014977 [Rhizopus arrhizus]|nr:hypothetical protein G6F23_014977 [Rhizopus arrhizus]